MKYFRLVFTCGPYMLYCYFKWILKYSRHPEKYPLEKRYAAARELITFVLKRMRVQLDLHGLEILKSIKGGALIAPNHLSMTDVLTAVAISEKPISFVGKLEVRKMIFVGRVLQAIDGLFLDRNDLRQNVLVMREVQKRFEEGKIVVIYPEGTRQKNVRAPLLPFHPGTFKVAAKSGVPIIPVAEYGTFRVLDPKHDYKCNLIQYKFMDPVTQEQYKDLSSPKLASYIQEKVQVEIDALREKDDEYFKNGGQHKKIEPPFWWEEIDK